MFCDSSIPKADGSFSIYDAVKETLIKSGEFKPEEIAFIHDANNDEQRTDMFEKVNNAEIKVIIGSTGNADRILLLCYERRNGIIRGILSERNKNEYRYHFGYLFRLTSRNMFTGNYRLNSIAVMSVKRILEEIKDEVYRALKSKLFHAEMSKCVYDNPCEAVNKFAEENRYTIINLCLIITIYSIHYSPLFDIPLFVSPF